MKQRHRPEEGGFTLLEVVIAMAVLGLILATGLGLLGVGLHSVKTSTDYTRAVLLATRQLEELRSQGVKPGFFDGTSHEGYRWTAEVSAEGPNVHESQARLFKVRVRVFWPGRGKEKQLELVTLATVIEKERFSAMASSS